VCYTANTGRSQFNYHLALIATDGSDAAEKLKAFQDGNEIEGLWIGEGDKGSEVAPIEELGEDPDWQEVSY